MAGSRLGVGGIGLLGWCVLCGLLWFILGLRIRKDALVHWTSFFNGCLDGLVSCCGLGFFHSDYHRLGVGMMNLRV